MCREQIEAARFPDAILTTEHLEADKRFEMLLDIAIHQSIACQDSTASFSAAHTVAENLSDPWNSVVAP